MYLKKVKSVINIINNSISLAERYALLLICTASVIAMFTQTICRYIFEISTPWAEEFCIYTWQWIAWIGGAYAVFSGDHLRINIMDPLLDRGKNPELAHTLIDLFATTIVILVCVIFLNAYAQYWAIVSPNPQISAATRWPLTVVQVALLIGSILMVVQGVLKWIDLVCDVFEKRRK